MPSAGWHGCFHTENRFAPSVYVKVLLFDKTCVDVPLLDGGRKKTAKTLHIFTCCMWIWSTVVLKVVLRAPNQGATAPDQELVRVCLQNFLLLVPWPMVKSIPSNRLLQHKQHEKNRDQIHKYNLSGDESEDFPSYKDEVYQQSYKIDLSEYLKEVC